MELVYKNISLGSDPEFFIQNEDGVLISSIGLIKGKKDKPTMLKRLGDGFAIQTDNVLGEFNVPHAYSVHEIVENISIMKAYIEGFLSSHGLAPLYAASGIYGDDQLESDEAKKFGCDPDYNAWTNCVNIAPEGAITNLRSAGFHIHVGYDNPNMQSNLNIIKSMDLFLGVPSILIDVDSRRRSLYGKAGCFRHTEFGVEYRVLSGFILSNKKLTKWAFSQAVAAVKALNTPGFIDLLNEKQNEIISCINNGDAPLASNIVEEFSLKLPY